MAKLDVKEKVLQAALCMGRQCWEEGMLSVAMMEDEYQGLCDLMVHDMVLRQSADGRLCNIENTPAVTDSAFCIPAVLYMAEKKTGEQREQLLTAAVRNIRFLRSEAAHAANGALYHIVGTREIWADSAAFLPYSLSICGYQKEAYAQMKALLEHLYIPQTGLYAHIYDDASGNYPDHRAWGVGNGWILTGLLRTAISFGAGMEEEKNELLTMFRTLLDTMLSYMTENGGFHDELDNKKSFLETETAAMTAVAVYQGYLEDVIEEDLLQTADIIRHYVLGKVTENGLVTDASSSPDFCRPGTAVECQAHVLMMEILKEKVIAKVS